MMQMGDVPANGADYATVKLLIGYRLQTTLRDEIVRFVKWLREYYGN